MSRADGSKPTLTVRRFRSIRRASSSSSIRSTAPRRRISSSGEGKATPGQDIRRRRRRLSEGLRVPDGGAVAVNSPAGRNNHNGNETAKKPSTLPGGGAQIGRAHV